MLQKKGNLFLAIKLYLRIPKENYRKYPEVGRENMYGYRELSEDIICSKTIFVSEVQENC